MNINSVKELLTIVLTDNDNIKSLISKIEDVDTKRKRVIYDHTNKLLELNKKIISENNIKSIKK
jgi:hypothetical protein